MNIPSYPYQPSLATRELLFLGFENDFNANICNYPYESEVYCYEMQNNPLKALDWLLQKVESFETYQPPFAVFCNLKWLESTGFQLSRHMMAHPDLRFVPVIALTETQLMNKNTLAANGIDDCYTVPAEWHLLEKRLEFLNQFKPSLLDLTAGIHTPLEQQYKTPVDKRVFDILAASIGILVSLPIWLPIAIAVRLESKGPVIYTSKRVGAGYRVFEFYKFRSMFADSERRLKELLHLNQYSDQSQQIFVKLARDPRITRVGRFIRKYSLDELPQLINVLRGDMSLVGNRPLPLYEAELLVRDDSCERFLAPAGLTGLWQISKRGRSDMSAKERISLDIQYSKQYSIWFDFSILARTIFAFVQKEDV
jgi:lipopolysaccharide/colanic/teichoic acid biosynthesis glycosyltransferase